MNKALAIVAVIVVVVGGVVFVATRAKKATPVASPTPKPTISITPSVSPTPSATVILTSSGPSPKTATIKAGNSVKFVNNSGATIEIASDPHPTHTNLSALNLGVVAPGKSVTVTLTKTGTWGYHNHLQPSVKGTIVVQ